MDTKNPPDGGFFCCRGFSLSRFPIPDSRFPIPDSRFPIPDSRFPIPGFTPESRIPNPESRLYWKS
ncbi:hypothetical protein AZ78_4970 [Lysobacter capsici AZ78]|uniref:Uncharacterized protein n=1 Tax=Lysobacter capsici AZ78 TaxID=1444315 RepID=A0A125U028_9GAMM|nr:hypothetical protein AZ78_4970 [Lysobacter capsici AZ78]